MPPPPVHSQREVNVEAPAVNNQMVCHSSNCRSGCGGWYECVQLGAPSCARPVQLALLWPLRAPHHGCTVDLVLGMQQRKAAHHLHKWSGWVVLRHRKDS